MADKTKRTHECITCEKFLGCKGMPLEAKQCLHYIERKKKDNGK